MGDWSFSDTRKRMRKPYARIESAAGMANKMKREMKRKKKKRQRQWQAQLIQDSEYLHTLMYSR
jgi:hypothetical protein